MDVFAILLRIVLSLGEIVSPILSKNCFAFFAAFLYPSTIIVG